MIGLVGIAMTFSALIALILRQLLIAAREAAEARKPQPLFIVSAASESGHDVAAAWDVAQKAARHELGAQG